MKISELCFVLLLIFSTQTVHAQKKDVHGTVRDPSGKPVSQVEILEGSRLLATTDDSGRFHVVVPLGTDSLSFRRQGYIPRNFGLKALDNGVSIVQMAPQGSLDNVSVSFSNGYSETKQIRSTASISVVDNRLLNLQTGTNILERLNGVVPGVLFDNNTTKLMGKKELNFNVRGVNSINGMQDPLIIVDNFPYKGDISNINPNDVERMTVLKDAGAAAIWGAQAGNGVIVIKTKKGRNSQGLKLAFNIDHIHQAKPNLYYPVSMSPSDYIDVEQMLFRNGYFDGSIQDGTVGLPPAVHVFSDTRNGLISQQDSMAQITQLKQQDARDSYEKEFYRRAATDQYYLSLSGGSQQNSYYASLGWDKITGNLRQRNDRLNFTLSNQYVFAKKSKLDIYVNYTNHRNVSGAYGYNTLTVSGRLVPYLSFRDGQGNPTALESAYNNLYLESLPGGLLKDWKFYPAEEYRLDRTVTSQQSLLLRGSLNLGITKWLNALLLFQYQSQTGNTDRTADAESYFVRNLVNYYSQWNGNTNTLSSPIPEGDILDLAKNTYKGYFGRGQLGYDNHLGKWDVSALAGMEVRQNEQTGNTYRQYGYTPENLQSAAIDYTTVFPGRLYFGTTIPSGVSNTYKNDRSLSLYASANIAFEDRYMFYGSLRRDASNLFGVNTNKQWNPFWSLGAGWVVTNERFRHPLWLGLLKIRATYGKSGIIDPTRTAKTVIQYLTTDAVTGFPYSIVSQYGDPDLEWEKIATGNLGLDYSLFNGLVSGTIDYYRKWGSNLYGQSPIDYTVGWRSNVAMKNLAKSLSRGVDLVVNLLPASKSGMFGWGLTLNLSYNRSTVRSYYLDTVSSFYSPSMGQTIFPVVGKDLYGISSYRWAGLDPTNGNPQALYNGLPSSDYNAVVRSYKDPSTLEYHGSSQPRFWGTVIPHIAVSRFSLDFALQYKFAYYVYRPSLSYDQLFNNSIGNADYIYRWQKPGDETKTNVPSMVYPNPSYRDALYNLSDINVLNASQVRLQFVRLEYEIPKPRTVVLENWHARVYLNVSDVGLLWKKNNMGVDPDFPSSYKTPVSWTLGLKANF